jgi:ribosomal protein S18 acetylase RimI-like enzyme
MPEHTNEGIFAKQSLSEQELAAVKVLADVCTHYEQIDLRLGWSALQSYLGDAVRHFLCYKDGALIGFLSFAGIGGDEAEGTGMVHPDRRRKGVFRALVEAAKAECGPRGTDTLIFACDRRSAAARAALQALGAQHTFSEHKMELAEAKVSVEPQNRLKLQKASVHDADDIAEILAQDAGMQAERFRPMIAAAIMMQSRQYYTAKVDGQTVGTINIDIIDGDAYIYGFVVRPEQRGRGYGRQILARTIEEIVSERPQPVFLEVETNNAVALSLYRSLGFTITDTHDYYRVETRSCDDSTN